MFLMFMVLKIIGRFLTFRLVGTGLTRLLFVLLRGKIVSLFVWGIGPRILDVVSSRLREFLGQSVQEGKMDKEIWEVLEEVLKDKSKLKELIFVLEERR